MQLEFGDGSLETEKQAPIGTAGIVDTVTIGDETPAQPTDVQKRIPVGAVAREPRHVDRQDQPHFAEPDPADEFLEATAMRCGRAAQAEIGVDHVDIGFMPSEFAGALAKGVLEPQAFLIAHDLVRRRLPDVDDGLALQMRRLDQLGHHAGPPPEQRRCRRRSVVVAPAAVSSRDLRVPCS